MSIVLSRLRCAATLIAALATLVSGLAIAPSAQAGGVPSCSAAGIGLASLGGPNFYIDSGATPQFTSSYTGYRVTNSTGAAMTDTWVSLSSFTGNDLQLASGQPAAEQIPALSDGAAKSRFWYLTAPTASATAQGFTVTVYQHNPDLPNASVLCTENGGFNQVIGTLSASANKVTGISVSNAQPSLGSTFSVSVTGDTGTMGSGPGDGSDPYSLWMSPAVSSAWPAGAFRLTSTNLNISPDGTAAPEDHPDVLRVADLGPTGRSYTATYTFQAVGFTDGPTTLRPVQEIASGTQVKHTGSYSVTLPTIAPPVNTVYLGLSATPSDLDLGGGQADYTATVHGTAGASVDSFVLTPPPGASFVSGSAGFAGTSLGDPVVKNGTFVFSGPFTLDSTTDTLTFSLQLASTPGDQVTSLLAGLGSALLGTDPSDLSGAHPASATVNVDTAPVAPDFTINAPPGQISPVDVLSHATDADDDPLTLTDVTAPQYGAATLSEGVLTYQPDAENTSPDSFTYTVDDGRGGSAQGTVTVNVQELTAQTITFPTMPAVVLGDPAQASAVADSDLPVTYTSLTPEVCTVDADSGVVTLLAAGTCTIAADQAGNDLYAPADQVTQSFAVDAPAELTDQVITFTAPTQLLTGPDGYQLTATSSAQLPVSFAVTAGNDVCSVSGATLTVTGTGGCDVQASAEGDQVYAAAAPVTQHIDVVAPRDDTVTLPSTTGQPASSLIDVTANDPTGLTLTAAGSAAHGTVSVGDGMVTYTPQVTFRGVDQFDYTVSDGVGRTAPARVTVRVRDAAPTAAGAAVRQVAGTVAQVRINAADLNGDPLSLTVLHRPASVPVTVTGLTVRLAPPATVTGRFRITLAVHDGAGGTVRTHVRDTVLPQPVEAARRTISSAGTHITWSKATATGATYRVRIGKHLACVTTGLSCDVSRLLGPGVPVWVRVAGRDNTYSAHTAARPVHAASVLVGVVYFDSGSWTLNDLQRARLIRLADRLRRNGFSHVQLNGYTDSIGSVSYNLHLSHQRTETIAQMLYRERKITSHQDWFGKANPAVPGRSAAKNRRVEILVS